jgi:hypothetical protein
MGKTFTVRDLPKTDLPAVARLALRSFNEEGRAKAGRPREITRQCVICGKNILIKVFPNGKYIGGNYFGVIEKAENYRQTGETMVLGGGSKAFIGEPVGKIRKWEYWECDGCYRKW